MEVTVTYHYCPSCLLINDQKEGQSGKGELQTAFSFHNNVQGETHELQG